MSKTLSLKMKDEVFFETEKIIGAIHTSKNAYINDALDFYNKFIKRTLIRKQLRKESHLVAESSLNRKR